MFWLEMKPITNRQDEQKLEGEAKEKKGEIKKSISPLKSHKLYTIAEHLLIKFVESFSTLFSVHCAQTFLCEIDT